MSMRFIRSRVLECSLSIFWNATVEIRKDYYSLKTASVLRPVQSQDVYERATVGAPWRMYQNTVKYIPAISSGYIVTSESDQLEIIQMLRI